MDTITEGTSSLSRLEKALVAVGAFAAAVVVFTGESIADILLGF